MCRHPRSGAATSTVSLLTFLSFASIKTLIKAAPEADFVEFLPGYGAPPSPQYSGLLDGSASRPGSKLHYWFAQYEGGCNDYEDDDDNDDDDGECWTNKPLVLWLNGGPGSSSLIGFLQEQGPLLFGNGRQDDHYKQNNNHSNNNNNNAGFGGGGKEKEGENTKVLVRNPYSWTKLANLVAIESPVGVGYSYCAEMTRKDDGQQNGESSTSSSSSSSCANDDDLTAQTLYAALRDFFTTKFPELRSTSFYVTGESYAGVYCPTLAKLILDNNDNVSSDQERINLVGMAVGDPCTDNEAQADSMDMLWYGHKYGFVLDEDFDLLWNHCDVRHAHPIRAGSYVANEYGKIAAVEKQSNKESVPDATSSEDETEMLMTVQARRRQQKSLRDIKRDFSTNNNLDEADKQKCNVAQRKFLLQTSKAFSQQWKHGYINDVTLYGPFAVVDSSQKGSLNYRMAQWMMSEEVRKALHVDSVPQTKWPGPNEGWTYQKKYAACNDDASSGAPSMVDFYQNIVPRISGAVLVYNGDTDPCVTYEGTRDAILNKVGFKTITGGGWRPWFFNATADTRDFLDHKDLLFGPSLATVPAGPQLGGLTIDLEYGLKFCTVHGSGHMVPQFRPRAALRMIASVLEGKPLAPLLPDDESMNSMSDSEFEDFMNNWTDNAKDECDVTMALNSDKSKA